MLIVDDEALARERLRTLLAKEADVSVVGECANGGEAVASIRALKPDLVFLDIRMPGLDGFDVLRELGDGLPAVVFVTAFDAYAVKAFEAHALDYLLKPVKPARLRQTLERARSRPAVAADAAVDAMGARLLALLEERAREEGSGYLSRLVVRTGDRVRFVKTGEIDWIEASGNYIIVHAGGEKHTLRETLGAIEAKLAPKRFQRLSRSAVVNLDRIREVQPLFHGEHVVILHDGARIPMTRGLRELQERLKFS